MSGAMDFAVSSNWLQDMADALALEADIIAEDGDYATAAQLRGRAAIYHEFVRVARSAPVEDSHWV